MKLPNFKLSFVFKSINSIDSVFEIITFQTRKKKQMKSFLILVVAVIVGAMLTKKITTAIGW